MIAGREGGGEREKSRKERKGKETEDRGPPSSFV